MQSLILAGPTEAKNDYIESIVKRNNIPSYGITSLEGTIKIEDVHRIVRTASIHTAKGQKRLTILNGTLTIPAQNALLKYLEELPESDFVVFLVDSIDTLLETIRSRCTEINLLSERKETDNVYANLLALLSINPDIHTALLLVSQHIATSEDYEKFLLELREYLIHLGVENSVPIPRHLVRLLAYLNRQSQYVKENNVNPKFTLESFTSTSW